MNFCPKCGFETKGMKFCPKCGFDLRVGPVEAPVVEAEPVEVAMPVRAIENFSEEEPGEIAEHETEPTMEASMVAEETLGKNSAPVEEDMRAALVRVKPEHYIPIFNDLDKTGGTGWNWCGFFFAPMWFAYRKMYGWAVLAILIPIIVSFLVGIILASSSAEDLTTDIMSRVLGLAFGIFFGAMANVQYKKRIYRLVKELPQDKTARAAFIKKKGGVNPGAMVLVLIIYLAIEMYGALISVTTN